jgi:hypothetical protein
LFQYPLTHWRFGACFIEVTLIHEPLIKAEKILEWLVPWRNWGACKTAPMRKLGNHGVGFFGVDAEVFYGFGYYARLDFALPLKFVQGG